MCLRASKTSLPISFIFSSSDSSRFSNIASACFVSFASMRVLISLFLKDTCYRVNVVVVVVVVVGSSRQ